MTLGDCRVSGKCRIYFECMSIGYVHWLPHNAAEHFETYYMSDIKLKLFLKVDLVYA